MRTMNISEQYPHTASSSSVVTCSLQACSGVSLGCAPFSCRLVSLTSFFSKTLIPRWNHIIPFIDYFHIITYMYLFLPYHSLHPPYCPAGVFGMIASVLLRIKQPMSVVDYRRKLLFIRCSTQTPKTNTKSCVHFLEVVVQCSFLSSKRHTC